MVKDEAIKKPTEQWRFVYCLVLVFRLIFKFHNKHTVRKYTICLIEWKDLFIAIAIPVALFIIHAIWVKLLILEIKLLIFGDKTIWSQNYCIDINSWAGNSAGIYINFFSKSQNILPTLYLIRYLFKKKIDLPAVGDSARNPYQQSKEV